LVKIHKITEEVPINIAFEGTMKTRWTYFIRKQIYWSVCLYSTRK